MGRTTIDTVALDADDTLWHSEVHFVDVENRFRSLIAGYVGDTIDGESTDSRLVAVERANLAIFGYGVKAFTLSMIETAIMLTDGEVSTDDVHHIVSWGKEMMTQPVELLDGVAETVTELARRYPLMLITKGDLLHQEAKIAESGLAHMFAAVEIVSVKNPETYRRILDRHALEPSRFAMVGNSVPSDVVPVMELGGIGIHIPHEVTWALETPGDHPVNRWPTLDSIRDLPACLESL